MTGPPLRDFWNTVAAGGTPTAADIEREGIPAKYVTDIRRQAAEVHALKAEGSMGAARQLARELESDWVRRLGDELEPPRPPGRDSMDPHELAALVRPGVTTSSRPRSTSSRPKSYTGPGPRELIEGVGREGGQR